MIRKLFDKYETLMCILLIVMYILVNSFCVQNFGVADPRSAAVNTVFSLLLIALTVCLKRTAYYGLTKVRDPKKYLYFIPLLFIVSVNLWGGINTENSADEVIFHVLTMINVGFIEELIFRGFLFKMMEKDNPWVAVAVTSLTFGIGHIINLFNGAMIIPTLLQVCYATAIGYLFVIIFYKSKSLIPCIIAHSLNNSLSVFCVENTVTLYIAPVFLIIVPVAYAVCINKTVRRSAEQASS